MISGFAMYNYTEPILLNMDVNFTILHVTPKCRKPNLCCSNTKIYRYDTFLLLYQGFNYILLTVLINRDILNSTLNTYSTPIKTISPLFKYCHHRLLLKMCRNLLLCCFSKPTRRYSGHSSASTRTFAICTVITIAPRVNPIIIGSDDILVMKNGKLVTYIYNIVMKGSPSSVLTIMLKSDKNGNNVIVKKKQLVLVARGG